MINGCKGVIFDFNGTLFFDSPKHELAWGKMAKQMRGFGVSTEEMRAHFFGAPNSHAVEYLLGRKCNEEEITKYSEMKESFYRDFCRADKETFHLVTGAYDFFDRLKASGIPFTIASASIKPNIDFFVESFHLDNWIRPEDIVYDDGSYADKVAMFQAAAKVIGVPVEECMIFEDSKSGIRDAGLAGCKNIVVMDSMGVAEKYCTQKGVVDVIRDFKKFI